jgi:hypothetical protein
MSIATSTAIALGVTAAVSAAGAAVAAHGAESAAKTQAGAEDSALSIQQQEYAQQQQNEAPYLAVGNEAAGDLAKLVTSPTFNTYAGGQFKAPTAAQAAAYPGEQFQLQLGAEALGEQASSMGNVGSGTEGVALQQYGQGLAQTDYANVYNQMLQQYMTNYGVWNQDTTNQVNRLQALTNTGANAAANVGQQGEVAAQTEGSDVVGAGTALASGTVGATNAVTGALGTIGNEASSLPLYSLLAQQQQMMNQSSYSGEMVGNTFYPAGYGPGNAATPTTGIGSGEEYLPEG